ncbi:MAG TPA: hypothetical protein VK430_06245 [Xanthobacteraceae bacterium]|nr:hypothetical protein [Xanthobacteraceae bacterium]
MAITLRKPLWAAGLGATVCGFAAAYAVADQGACGLEAGAWASPQQACHYAERPDDATKRFGEDALLEWHSGFYRFQGANCSIFSATLAAKICTLDVECSDGHKRSLGTFTIERQSAEQFRFGSSPDSAIYYHCASAVMRR